MIAQYSYCIRKLYLVFILCRWKMPDSIAIIGFWDFQSPHGILKFMFSEKATKFCEIFPLLLTTVHTVAFSEYMNFNGKFEFASFLKTSSPLFTHAIDTWCINNEPIPIHFARQFITVIRQLTSYIIKVHSNSIVLGAKLDHAKYNVNGVFFSSL